MNYPKPHYVYIRHHDNGGHTLVITSLNQEIQELPLNVDLAIHFAMDFMKAAKDLHKKQITQLSNKDQQKDMFDATLQGSGSEPGDNAEQGRLSRVASI